ncbi:MAG: hypothetical protein IID07_09835, partial [Gemmatimonadetes bacterium]|nr:hypothetical protein [Gemmatimonadota bacterium]
AAQAMQEALSQEGGASPGDTQLQRAQSQLVGGEPTEASMDAQSSQVTRSEGGSPGAQTGPAGNSTGDPSDRPLELGASTTLEAQLALEVIDGVVPDSPEDRDLDLDPEDIFQEASRQQRSIVQYRDIRALSQYSQGSALNAERIPWRYRSLVKKYFLAIRPDERK